MVTSTTEWVNFVKQQLLYNTIQIIQKDGWLQLSEILNNFKSKLNKIYMQRTKAVMHTRSWGDLQNLKFQYQYGHTLTTTVLLDDQLPTASTFLIEFPQVVAGFSYVCVIYQTAQQERVGGDDTVARAANLKWWQAFWVLTRRTTVPICPLTYCT